jgi:hypothetical protein
MSSNFTYSFVVILPFCANGRRWSQGGIVKRLTILIFVVRADSFKSYPDLHRLSIVTRLLTLRRHGIVRADGDFGVIHKLFPHRMTLYFAFLCDWSIASAVHKTCFFFCLAPLTSATCTVHWYVRTSSSSLPLGYRGYTSVRCLTVLQRFAHTSPCLTVLQRFAHLSSYSALSETRHCARLYSHLMFFCLWGTGRRTLNEV